MPRSPEQASEPPIEPQPAGIRLAVLAEVLYLANLLALPADRPAAAAGLPRRGCR